MLHRSGSLRRARGGEGLRPKFSRHFCPPLWLRSTSIGWRGLEWALSTALLTFHRQGANGASTGAPSAKCSNVRAAGDSLTASDRLSRFMPDLATTLARFPVPALAAITLCIYANLDAANLVDEGWSPE